MRSLLIVLAFSVLVTGCTSMSSVTPAVSGSSEPAVIASDVSSKGQVSPLGEWDAVGMLEGLTLRDVVSDSMGKQFIVQDQSMSLFLVSASGKTPLGQAPDIGFIAAWDENDLGYAFARRSETGKAYEIVGVGHEGSEVLA